MIDSVYRGSTPLLLSDLSAGSHSVAVRKPGCHPFITDVVIIPGDTIVLTAHIAALTASASIRANRPGALIRVNGDTVGVEQVDSLVLSIGGHSVSILEPTTGRSVDGSVTLDQARHISIIAEYDAVAGDRLLSGLLLPGILQFKSSDVLKGTTFSLAGAGSIAFLVSALGTRATTENDYQEALDAYDRASSEVDAQLLRSVVDRRYEDFKRARNRARIAVGIMAAVWLGNAVDVALNHWHTDRIEIIANVAPTPVPFPIVAEHLEVRLGVSIR